MVKITNANVLPTSEHNDTVTSYFMYEKEELRNATSGSYLEFINEFELEPGVFIEPHFHNSHEFYYVIRGSGTMRVDECISDVSVGDLIHIEPNSTHSIRAGKVGIRCFAFASSFQAEGEEYTKSILQNWP